MDAIEVATGRGRLSRAVRGLAARLMIRRVRRIPVHIAIIPDGNRRWARRRGLPAWVGHYTGYRVMRRVLDKLWELGVKHVTVYALSRENCLKRSREELEKLYALLLRAFQDLENDPRVVGGELRVNIVGDRSFLPGRLVEEIEHLESMSNPGAERTLNICVCYSGRWEIVEAVRRLLELGLEPSEENLNKLMPLNTSPPDLLIRTGGELRLSNYLLWHVAYTELYFTRTLWPDFDEFELAKALLSYSRRERRFGA